MGDPLRVAVEHALRVKEAVDILASRGGELCEDKGWGPEDGGAAFARRAKDLPSLLISAGLKPALLFYMAKSGEGELRSAYRLLREGAGAGGDLKWLCSLKSELGGGEGHGYSLMLAAVLAALGELGFKGAPDVERGGLKEIAHWLANLKEEHEVLDIIEPYLVELKKAAEAFFGERGG